MDGWMDACMHAWMDGWIDGCMMHACMHAWMHGCMDAWMHGCMDVCVCVYTHARRTKSSTEVGSAELHHFKTLNVEYYRSCVQSQLKAIIPWHSHVTFKRIYIYI